MITGVCSGLCALVTKDVAFGIGDSLGVVEEKSAKLQEGLLFCTEAGVVFGCVEVPNMIDVDWGVLASLSLGGGASLKCAATGVVSAFVDVSKRPDRGGAGVAFDWPIVDGGVAREDEPSGACEDAGASGLGP